MKRELDGDNRNYSDLYTRRVAVLRLKASSLTPACIIGSRV